MAKIKKVKAKTRIEELEEILETEENLKEVGRAYIEYRGLKKN